MLKRRQLPEVSLDDICKQKLRDKILSGIEKIDIEEWEKMRPGVRIIINKKNIEVSISIKGSTQKFFAWISTAIGFAVVLGKIISWLLPILREHYSSLPSP